MKIAHVQVKPIMSGAQQISYEILSSLALEGHDLYLICADFGDESIDFVDKFNELGVSILTVSSLKRELGFHDFKVITDLYKIFKKYNFDVVHTNSTKPGIFARIAAKLAGTKKIIHTVHGIAFHNNVNPFVRLAYYLLENFSTLFGHYNLSVNKYYRKFYPFVETRTIYNGCDFSKLKPSFQKKINEKIHFAFLGRLDTQKNPLEFIKAIYLLSKEVDINQFKFTIAGDGELRSDCEDLLKKYKLNNDVIMYGWVYDKNIFLNTVDVLCQPSLWEAFGLVFCEAGFFKIPSIAKSVEGIPEVVLDNQSGLLYSGNAVELKEKMLFCIENPALIHEYGEKAYEYVTREFTVDRMVDEYKMIYFQK